MLAETNRNQRHEVSPNALACLLQALLAGLADGLSASVVLVVGGDVADGLVESDVVVVAADSVRLGF